MRVGKVIAAGFLALTLTLAAAPAEANWLTRLAREAAESGGGVAGRIGKTGVASLDNAAAHIATLPKLSTGTALAAHLTPEGHWKFVNREGQVYTAATPDELARVGAALAPEAAPGGKLAYYLSEDTVFAQRSALKDLPIDADLHVVVGKEAYRLRRTGSGNALAAEFRPNVVISLTDRALFEEAVYRLSRPLNRSNIRALALETGGPSRLSSAPRFDPATKAALVDQIDPGALPQALGSLKGQTALVSGRIEGDLLTFRPSSGPEQSIEVSKLVRAAEEADVNLVLMHTGSSHQPGGRNWLWQTVSVSGLDDALKRATFADFLSALGGASSELSISAAPSSMGRVVISAVPAPTSAGQITDTLTGWIKWDEWLGEVTGHVAVKSVEVFARNEAQERELDARLLPWLPSTIQFLYLASVAFGVLAWHLTAKWWAYLWPPERREEYAGRIGYWAARVARSAAFLLLFLPVVGMPAVFWLGLLQIWGVMTAPFRAMAWVWGKLSPRRA